ncbi:hypothetical protein CVT25_005783 [Psilocybe cyanescens]|uniref:Homeobox domain-containing protein n=1 Tax=Psilocybe cyanescens TaxID=93625 RepID=A0A409VLN9_PSICY|nr:hypothetical protein CVT25_005783 [Psilocybe cyanescens]
MATSTLPQSTSDSEKETLMSIHRIASSLAKDFSAYRLATQLPDLSDSSIPELDLSFPPDILSPILSLQIPYDVLQQIVRRFTRLLSELQQEYTNSYQEACRAHASIHGFDGDLRSEYIPVLEKYFEYNGYPSVLHRSILAQKTSMTPRQIEVWFQNHRKRSRQDGKIVRRLDSDVPLKRSLGVLAKNAEPYQLRLCTPSDDKNGLNSDDKHKEFDIQRPKSPKLASCLEETKDTHEDDLIRPPHAFPEPRKSQHDDPFPNDNGVFRFPPPIWRRKPATTPIIPTEVDMDDFARTFHMKLNFINGPWKRESTPSKSDFPSFTPWFAPSRTIPPRAPHPSLVRTYVSSLVESSIMRPLTLNPHIFDFGEQPNKPGISCVVRLPCGPPPSDSSIIESFTLPSQVPRQGVPLLPQSTPFSPTPSASLLAPPGEVPRRKVSPLPRRGPSKTQSFGSRTSSFSSESSSSSDDTISSPSTPPSLPNQTLVSVESDDSTYNFDSYNFDFSSLTSDPSPRTFDFSEEKSPYDEQSPTLFQDFTPLVIC